MSTATMSRSERSTRADLVHLDRALAELERASRQIRAAETIRAEDPRASFELVHRAALRAAGVVIEQENRTRRRRLPLNAWAALSRCGSHHRRRAEEVEPMVAERARLDRDAAAHPEPLLFDEHVRATRAHIEGIRAETLLALLPEGAPLARPTAGANAPRG